MMGKNHAFTGFGAIGSDVCAAKNGMDDFGVDVDIIVAALEFEFIVWAVFVVRCEKYFVGTRTDAAFDGVSVAEMALDFVERRAWGFWG